MAFRLHPVEAPWLDLLLVPGGAALLLGLALALERRAASAAKPPPRPAPEPVARPQAG